MVKAKAVGSGLSNEGEELSTVLSLRRGAVWVICKDAESLRGGVSGQDELQGKRWWEVGFLLAWKCMVDCERYNGSTTVDLDLREMAAE